MIISTRTNSTKIQMIIKIGYLANFLVFVSESVLFKLADRNELPEYLFLPTTFILLLVPFSTLTITLIYMLVPRFKK